MSSVLRRKIEARSGVPPNILQMKVFWDMLQANTKTWILETFGVEASTSVDARQVLSGKTARAVLDSQFSFAFASEYSSGLCAIAIDNHTAIQNAAARLDQNADDFKYASPLFMRLLCEQPAISLWRNITKGLVGGADELTQTPLSEISSAVGGFDQTSRYLQVGLRFMLEEQAAQVLMLFDFDFVQCYVRDHMHGSDDGPAEACSASQKSLRESVRASKISLNAVLERLTLSIGECSRLSAGQILPLRGVDLGHLSLSAETVNGKVDIGHGEMGVWKQQRALKLSTEISQAFAQDLAEN